MKPANPYYVCACGGRKNRSAKQCINCHHKNSKNRMRNLVILLGLGRTMKEIALMWHISVKTAEYHWSMAKVKYGIQCYQDATFCALRHHWITSGKSLSKRMRGDASLVGL